MSILITALVSLAILMSGYGFLELKLLRVKRYEISDPNVPDSLKGKRIALLSDLHCVYHGKKNIRLFRMLKAEKPDYIVLSGDVINGVERSELRYAFRLFRRLRRLKVPVLYTFGNHEEKMRDNDLKAYRRLKRYAKKHMILLNNRAYRPEGTEDVAFVGLNLPLWMYHGHDGNGLIKRRTDLILDRSGTRDCYKILVVHDPEHMDKYAESGYELCLSGHVHGGIVYLPLLGGLISPRLQIFNRKAKGYHEQGRMKAVISGGIGWHDIPIRLFNHPEVVIVSFR